MAGKRITTAGIAVRVLIIIALAIGIYFVWQWRTAGPVAQLGKIQRGDDRDRVVDLLGPPDAESDAFPLPQAKTLAGQAEEVPPQAKTLAGQAEEVPAKTWLLYEGGMGVKCVVGLDGAGNVVFTGNTGT